MCNSEALRQKIKIGTIQELHKRGLITIKQMEQCIEIFRQKKEAGGI